MALFGLVAANLAAVAAGALALLVRQAGHASWNTIWAEDGWVFLPRALLHPLSGLLSETNGYLQLLPQLIADAVARLPLRDAAAGLAICGALVASCCALFVYHASAGHVREPILRALLAASVILLPTAVIEIANNGVNTPWYLLFAMFWALLWRPRSGAGAAVAAAICLVAMASQIVGVLYLPLVIARLLALPKLREQAATFGWLAGIALQAPAVLASKLPRDSGSFPPALSFYFHHVIVAAVTGWHLGLRLHAESGFGPATVIAACLVLAAVAWGLARGDARVRLFVVAALLCGTALAVIPALARPWVAGNPVTPQWLPGSRYTDTPVLLTISLAVVVVDARLRRSAARNRLPAAGVAAAAVLAAILMATWIADFRYLTVRDAGPDWPQTVSRFDSRCRHRPASAVQPLLYWEANKVYLPCSVADRTPAGQSARGASR